MSKVCTSTSSGGVECETKNPYSTEVMIGGALCLLLLVVFLVKTVRSSP